MDRTCPNCLKSIPSRSYDVHESTCRRHVTFCGGCSKPVRNSDLADHMKEFHHPISCRLCNQNVPTHLMDLHETSVCPATILSCEYCSLEMKRNLLSHHMKMCGERTEPCQRCFTKVKLVDMKEHKEMGCSNPGPAEPLPTLEVEGVSAYTSATPTNYTQQNFVNDVEIIQYDSPSAWQLPIAPHPQRSMYGKEEPMDCDSPITYQTSFPQEPRRPVYSAWTDDKTSVHSLRQENVARDIDVDHKLALQFQQHEPLTVASTSSDTEYTRKLQEEEDKRNSTYQIDETLAKQYKKQEAPAIITSSDIEYARKLQEENKVHLASQIDEALAKQYQQAEMSRVSTNDDCYQTLLQAEQQRHKMHEFDLEFARKLQQKETAAQSVTRPSTDNDIALALKLQSEETAAQSVRRPSIDNDIALALKLQKEESAAESVTRPSIDNELALALKLQSEETAAQQSVTRPSIDNDIALALKLQSEETTVQSLVRPNTDGDIALALKLQNEESMTVTPGGSYADIELARKLQEEENEKTRIQAQNAARDLEIAQKLQEEMNRGNSSVATSNDMPTGAVISPRAELTEVDNRPPEWQEQSQTTEVFLVPQGSVEWTKVEQKFKSTLSNQIVSISRIQNTWLWDFYCFHRKKLHQKNNGAVNEMELFHGTRQNNPKLIYEGEQGFDMRFSNKGMWGMANYFAVKASYSHRYSFNSPDGCKEMFLAKVLIGEPHRCAPNNTLRKPPQKPHRPSEQNMLFPTMDYDTVTGETNGSQVFMTYDNCKAYPAYIIKYR